LPDAAGGGIVRALPETVAHMHDESDPDAYQRKVQKIRESYEERKAQATGEKGLIAVFTGTGKGKSTAAFGMALRALQHGMKLGVVQYVKGAIATAETDAFGRFGAQVEWHRMGEGFSWITQDAELDRRAAERAWELSLAFMARPEIGMLVLDELIVAMRLRQLDEASVLEALKNKRPEQHVILTGRGASKELIELADLVTEMKMIKHPYKAGIGAQRGIEF
jgi:cob(I)alamin adenosyltransferase